MTVWKYSSNIPRRNYIYQLKEDVGLILDEVRSVIMERDVLKEIVQIARDNKPTR